MNSGVGTMFETDIVKLEYRIEFFDVSVMAPGARRIVTITDDGTIVAKEYNPKCRKAYNVVKGAFPLDAFEKLCMDIEDCIRNADRLDFYVDDSSEELKIFHKYGRIQTMDRGLGNESTDIGSVMNTFISEYLGESKIRICEVVSNDYPN